MHGVGDSPKNKRKTHIYHCPRGLSQISLVTHTLRPIERAGWVKLHDLVDSAYSDRQRTILFGGPPRMVWGTAQKKRERLAFNTVPMAYH